MDVDAPTQAPATLMDAILFRMIDTVPHPYLFVFMFIAIFQLYHLSQRTAAVLINFLKALMHVLNAPAFQFPNTITTMRDYIGFEQLTAPLTMYVVCPACHAIYPSATTGLFKRSVPLLLKIFHCWLF